MYIGIAHGVGYVVRFCRTPDINLQAQADGKLIAYHVITIQAVDCIL